MRQFDSAKLIPSLKTIESLIKYSEQSKLISLVPKLNELIENKKQDNQQQINLYSALPSKQSTLQINQTNLPIDEITPLIFDKSMFEKQIVVSELSDRILDEIEPNRFDEIDECKDVRSIDEDDELLKVVTTGIEIDVSSKNPFKRI